MRVDPTEWSTLSVPTLVHLGLGETSVNDSGLSVLVGSNINLITLDYCEITDGGLEVLSPQYLTFLSLSHCQFITDEGNTNGCNVG